MIADLPPPRGFTDALKKAAASGYGLIAEFKRASPSRGVINAHADPESVAMSYEAGGATCLSVLTDAAFFHGSIADMVAAKGATLLPILRKDFIIDPVQIAEARAYGGDAILLILSALSDAQARELEDCARFHGLDVLIETHDADEVARALALTAPMIGVNNRNLRSMTTDLAVGEALLAQIPHRALPLPKAGCGLVMIWQRWHGRGRGVFWSENRSCAKMILRWRLVRFYPTPYPQIGRSNIHEQTNAF